jgi:hypothetical protein
MVIRGWFGVPGAATIAGSGMAAGIDGGAVSFIAGGGIGWIGASGGDWKTVDDGSGCQFAQSGQRQAVLKEVDIPGFNDKPVILGPKPCSQRKKHIVARPSSHLNNYTRCAKCTQMGDIWLCRVDHLIWRMSPPCFGCGHTLLC